MSDDFSSTNGTDDSHRGDGGLRHDGDALQHAGDGVRNAGEETGNELLPRSIRDLLAHLGAGDSSVVLALSSLLDVADDDGTAGLDAVAEAYRIRYLTSLRTAGKDAEGEAGRLGMDAVRSYLTGVVLPKLVDAGMVEPAEDLAEPTARISIQPRLWPELAGRRSTLAEMLRVTGEHAVMEPGAVPAVAGASTAEPALSVAPIPGGSVLEATGLVKMYRRRKVVNDVALRLQQGEIVGLLGPNGAGKTTVFYMIVGLIQPMAGRILLDGNDVTGMAMYRRARRGIGYLSQEPSIFRKLTVEENILAILETLPLPRAERHERLESLLDELSIKHLRDSKAYALSGGERRRLEITRALVTRPKFMMLDEPFAGVDPIAVHDIQTIVAGLRHRGIGVLISDHNVEQTLDIVDRAYIMFDGQVKVSGTVRELIFDDTVADIYLGPTLTARLRARFSANANGGTEP